MLLRNFSSVAGLLLLVSGCWGARYREQAAICGSQLREDAGFKAAVKTCHKQSMKSFLDIYEQSSLSEKLALIEKEDGNLSEGDEILNHFMSKCMEGHGYTR